MGAAVLAEPLVTTYHEAIDRYHLTERLGEVLRYLEPDASARGDRLSRWNESLDRNDNAIYRIRAWVRDRYADALARNDRILLEQLEPHLTYLENNAYLMRYVRLRAVGLPVGSGVTEGACKSVIQDANERQRAALAAQGTRGRPVVTVRAHERSSSQVLGERRTRLPEGSQPMRVIRG